MEKDVALWIDHRQAVLAVVAGDTDDLMRIESGLEKHVRFSGGEGNPEDARERQFETHLNQYYDRVVASLRDARSILIMGPGEAKEQLEKRLRDAGRGKAIVGSNGGQDDRSPGCRRGAEAVSHVAILPGSALTSPGPLMRLHQARGQSGPYSGAMEIEFPGGAKVDALHDGLRIRTDQPDAHGARSAPSPFDLFLASIGTCAGFYVLRFFQQRNLDTAGLALSVTPRRDPERKLVTKSSSRSPCRRRSRRSTGKRCSARSISAP